MTTATSAPTVEQVRRAVRATYAVFIGSGFFTANWAARIPQVKSGLHLDAGELGYVLLSIACGSVLALPLSGMIVSRIGSRASVSLTALIASAGLAVASIGFLAGVVPVVIGLFFMGFGFGSWDVSMNVQGADVERHLGKAIMPRFHAGFSVGTVAGALLGAAMVAIGVPVTAHLLIICGVVAVAMPWSARAFIPDTEHVEAKSADAPASHPLARWLEPRTLIVGAVVLAFAFTEGVGNDWISVALNEDFGTPAAVGTLGYATFLAAMTAGRWVGPGVLDRFGRVVVVRALGVVAVAGLVMFVASPWAAVAFAGTVLWGIGASLGFPVGMSAAADEPAAAAGRVSVVASIGYCAFLGGPPLIGFLGDHFSVTHAFVAVMVALVIALPLVAAMRPPSSRVARPTPSDVTA